MKRTFVISLVVATGLALPALAQVPSAPAPAAADTASTNIAVISFQGAVEQTNEFQRNFADLEKKYSPRRDHLKALNDEIETLTKQLQAQGDKLSDEERATRTRTLEDKKKQLQRGAEDAQNDLQQEMQTMYTAVAAKVYDVLASYAEQHRFSLVLDVAQQQTPVMYAVQSTDISKAVLDAYNVKSGVPAPPPAPVDAPTPAKKPATRPAGPSH